MASLYYDGDVRRIYEVPDDSSFVVVGGFRVYTPNNLGAAATAVDFTAIELWSQWVDYHEVNKWSTLCFDRSGGAFRETTDEGDQFALTDIRFVNGWQFVPADYRHICTLNGNILPDSGIGYHFDTERITATPPPEVKVLFGDRGSLTRLDGGGSVGVVDMGEVWAAMTVLADYVRRAHVNT